MAIQIDIEFPDDNAVSLSPKFLHGSSGSVRIRGRGNRLIVEEPFLDNVAHFHLDGGAAILVGENSNLNALQVHALADGVRIEIGAWASFNGASQITAHERATIRIGARCLFGSGCSIASSDVHKILDLHSRERLNPAADIEIGEHVWVAPGVTILRNAVIGHDSVVGAGSIVRHAFPAHVCIAGAPARIVRTGIDWEF